MDNPSQAGCLIEEIKHAAMAAFPAPLRLRREGALWISLPGAAACLTAALMREQQAAGVPMFVMSCGPNHCTEPFGYGDQLPAAPLVGRGFRHAVHDCWSMCRDHYRQIGVQLLDYPRDWGWWKDRDLIEEGAVADFDRVDAERWEAGDLVGWCFLPGNRMTHSSVYLGDGNLLHHTSWRGRHFDPGSVSEIVPVDKFPARQHSRWRPRG